MGKKYKKIWNSKAEYEEHERRVDEDLKRLRALAEKAQAELDRKQAATEDS